MGIATEAVKRLFKQFPMCHLGVGSKAAARTGDIVLLFGEDTTSSLCASETSQYFRLANISWNMALVC